MGHGGIPETRAESGEELTHLFIGYLRANRARVEVHQLLDARGSIERDEERRVLRLQHDRTVARGESTGCGVIAAADEIDENAVRRQRGDHFLRRRPVRLPDVEQRP